jgi:MoxR-like ATPase
MEYDYSNSALDIDENLWYFNHFCLKTYRLGGDKRNQDFEKTSRVLRLLLRGIVDSGNFSDEEVTAIKFVILTGLNTETVEQQIEETTIDGGTKQGVANELDETVGIVGGTNLHGSVENQEETADSFLEHMKVLLDDERPDEEYDEAVEEILSLSDNLEEIALGTLSTVFCLLQPMRYPIVNGPPKKAFELCFNLDIDVSPSEYLNVLPLFDTVRSEFGFDEHYGELDYFSQWVNEDTDIEKYIQKNNIESRDVWQIGTGDPKKDLPSKLWPVWREEGICSIGWDIGDLDDYYSADEDKIEQELRSRYFEEDDEIGETKRYFDRFYREIDAGDIIVAKDGYEILGIGVVQKGGYHYCGDYLSKKIGEETAHAYVHPVEWIVIPEEADTQTYNWNKSLGQGTLMRTDNFEAIRLKLATENEELIDSLMDIEESVSNPTEGSLPSECTGKPPETEYFILKTGSDEYEDKPEAQYHFRGGIPEYRQMLEADHIKFVYLEDGLVYAKGSIDNIRAEEEEDKEDTQYFADVSEFESIEPINFDAVRDRLAKNVPPEQGIAKIPEDDYRLLLSQSSGTNLSELIDPPEFSLDGKPEGLYFEDWDDIKNQIEASLNSGKNIILNGPPGTGKTKIAKWVCEQVSSDPEDGGYDEVDGYEFTTATADWTAFDTIGGYVPSTEDEEKELEFEPRIFLNRFRDEDGAKNEWLLIDEINRSDIDKAFGQLFSVLSEDSVTLPYERDDTVEVVWTDDEETVERVENNPDKFPVTESWRLMATMNTHDKASLYEMSYAFMRRFNFIHVGVPEPEESLLEPNPDDGENFSTEWIEEGIKEDIVEQNYEDVTEIWKKVNKEKEIGPSIIRDILSYLDSYPDEENGAALTNAVVSLVFPQMEGMRKDKQVRMIDSLRDVESIEQERLTSRAEDIFRRNFSDDDQDTA